MPQATGLKHRDLRQFDALKKQKKLQKIAASNQAAGMKQSKQANSQVNSVISSAKPD
jgi:hypothetical protein